MLNILYCIITSRKMITKLHNIKLLQLDNAEKILLTNSNKLRTPRCLRNSKRILYKIFTNKNDESPILHEYA